MGAYLNEYGITEISRTNYVKVKTHLFINKKSFFLFLVRTDLSDASSNSRSANKLNGIYKQ